MESVAQPAPTSCTPGPWRAVVKDGLPDIWYIEHPREGTWPIEIAVLYPGNVSPEECEGNARRVEALPDLLDALNGLLGLVQLAETGRPDLRLSTNHHYVDALALVERLRGTSPQPPIMDALLNGRTV